MNNESWVYGKLKCGCVIAVIVCVSLFNVSLTNSHAAEASAITEPDDPQASVQKISRAEEKIELDEPQAEESNFWLYTGIGVGVVGVAGLVIGLSDSGGGSSSSSADTVDTDTDTGTEGISGSDWAGVLNLVNGYRENVSATVTQKGSSLTITTTSSQAYGQLFVGTIDSSGYVFVYDQTTGEDWTTHDGPPASSTRIEIYDYVNNFTGLDSLILKR